LFSIPALSAVVAHLCHSGSLVLVHMASSAAKPTPKTDASRVPLLVTSLLILVAIVDSQVVPAIAPHIAAGLKAAKPVVAASATAYSIAAAAVALLLGRYSKRINTEAWLLVAAAIFVVASVLAAASPHIIPFFAARSLAGLAGGLISALAIAAIANASSYAHRGKKMSGVAVAYFLAPVLGVPLGALIAGLYGWRVVFLSSAVAVAIAGLLVRQFPLSAATPDERDDEKPDAASETKAGAWRSLWKLATRSRSTRMGIVSAFFVSGGLVGFITYLGTWLSDAFYAGPREVGSIYALAGIGAVAGGALGGYLADRYGKRSVAAKSSVGMAVLLPLLPTFTRGPALFVLIGATAFLAAVRVAPLQALITELVRPSERPAYIALRNGSSQLGIAAAVFGGGFIYPRYGLAFVGAFCALLTLLAWIAIRRLDDPHGRMAGNKAQSTPLWKRLGRKMLIAVSVLLLLIVVGLPWLLSFAITKAGTRPQDSKLTDTPAQQGAAYEDVTFVSQDGNRLSGWYLASRAHSTTVVMTHGLFRSRYEMLDRAVVLWQQGYGVLVFDLRRHGKSPAEFSTLGFNERHDVEAAMRYVRERAPHDRIVLMGVSMGAAATLLAAAETKDVAGVISESSFLSFRDTVYHHLQLGRIPTFPFAGILTTLTALRMNFEPSDFDLLKAVQRISCPILFIGGTADRRMPNDKVLEPMYAAATNPLKRKLIVEGATHGRAFDTDSEAYSTAVREFLQSIEATTPSP
jgi:predicted MFS family arabinose efflux permease/pimeloyl-ACP methyl ester carboxylesterase